LQAQILVAGQASRYPEQLKKIILVFHTDELQADLKTFTSLGCYGASAVTALTAQNTKGVQAVHAVSPSFVEDQVRYRP
jgi:Phosphomethylpyrimidine kinase